MRWPPERDSFWAWLFLALAIACLLLAYAPTKAHGQPSLNTSLGQAEQNLTLLVSRLEERKKQADELQANLQKVGLRLADSEASLRNLEALLAEAQSALENSRKEQAATSSSLETLWKRYNELDKSWQAYRDEMRKQVAQVQRERNIWRAAGISGWLAALAMAIFTVVK